MTDDHRPNGDDDQPSEFIRTILELLAEMEEHSERSERGRWTGDRSTVDYSISVSGLDEASRRDLPGERRPGDERGTTDERRTTGGGGTTDWTTSPTLTTREFDDGMLVVVDLSNLGAEDVATDLDRDGRSLSITVDDDVVGRVPLEDGAWRVVDCSVNNGVVEVRLTHE